MKIPSVDTIIAIQSVKHDGDLHRRWEENIILYQDDNLVVGFNDRTNVKERMKPTWRTNEPAIFYFDRRYWFNIIYLLTDQPFYYCNLSSPFTYDQGILQYIDYDLDVIVGTDGSYEIVDQKEYAENGQFYQYPPSVRQAISTHLGILIEWITTNKGPFNQENMNCFYTLYKEKR